MLNQDFDDAMQMAIKAHRVQLRKDDKTPYMAHLLAVCSLVMEMGADQDTIIAALLHDSIEDAGGDIMRQAIIERFGESVARIVEEVTETDLEPKPPWKERKVNYIEHLQNASDEALLVALADKLHNARDTLRVKSNGVDVWSRFNAGVEEQQWWYQELGRVFSERLSGNDLTKAYVTEFNQVVQDLFIDIQPEITTNHTTSELDQLKELSQDEPELEVDLASLIIER